MATRKQASKAISKAVRESDKSMSAIARQIGVSGQAVSNWATGIRAPSEANAKKLARVLKIDPADITTAPAKKKAPARKSPAAKARKPTVVKVKTEPTRRSRRSSGYKKGSFSVAHMERVAWSGSGSSHDPIRFHH